MGRDGEDVFGLDWARLLRCSLGFFGFGFSQVPGFWPELGARVREEGISR